MHRCLVFDNIIVPPQLQLSARFYVRSRVSHKLPHEQFKVLHEVSVWQSQISMSAQSVICDSLGEILGEVKVHA